MATYKNKATRALTTVTIFGVGGVMVISPAFAQTAGAEDSSRGAWMHQGSEVKRYILENLTEEQRQEIREKFAEGGRERAHPGRDKLVEHLSEFLGIDPQETEDALASGVRPHELVVSKDRVMEDFLAYQLEQMKIRLQERIDAGEIDQTRADAMLARAQQRHQRILDKINSQLESEE